MLDFFSIAALKNKPFRVAFLTSLLFLSSGLVIFITMYMNSMKHGFVQKISSMIQITALDSRPASYEDPTLFNNKLLYVLSTQTDIHAAFITDDSQASDPSNNNGLPKLYSKTYSDRPFLHQTNGINYAFSGNTLILKTPLSHSGKPPQTLWVHADFKATYKNIKKSIFIAICLYLLAVYLQLLLTLYYSRVINAGSNKNNALLFHNNDAGISHYETSVQFIHHAKDLLDKLDNAIINNDIPAIKKSAKSLAEISSEINAVKLKQHCNKLIKDVDKNPKKIAATQKNIHIEFSQTHNIIRRKFPFFFEKNEANDESTISNTHEEDIENNRVLIIENNEKTQLIARETLRKNNLSVIEAYNSQQAIEYSREYQPDLIILNIHIPNEDGYALCAKLRQLSNDAYPPIFIITQHNDIDAIQLAYEAGATDFITTPINWLILHQRIKYMLRSSNAYRKLQRNKNRLARAQRISNLGDWSWDYQSDFFTVSNEVFRLHGLEEQEINDIDVLLQNVHIDDKEATLKTFNNAINSCLSYELEYTVNFAGNQRRIIAAQGKAEFNHKNIPVFIAGTFQDITSRKEAENKIASLAYFDGLTGLPNRQLFLDTLEDNLELAKRHNRIFALLFIDLDNFKRINDTLGHTVGDQLLESISFRLKQSLRRSDRLSRAGREYKEHNLARLGGDEFVILLTDIERNRDIATVSQRIIDNVSKPLTLKENEVLVTPSIGIAVYPNDGEDAETLLQNADIAMYNAKTGGRNNYQFYASQMNEKAAERLQLEEHLRKAIERNELEVYYQPQLDLHDDKIIAVEALLRWFSPKLGMVSPVRFIPVAEETGLIMELGKWVIHQACRQITKWHNEGIENIKISINLSGIQFMQNDLVEQLENIFDYYETPTHLIELELTESVIMDNSNNTIETLQKIKNLGCSLAIDDFGTGYSSLSYLKQFPLDALKIDKSFIKDIRSDPNDVAIIQAIIVMAHALDLKVIAEGVESSSQSEFLLQNECDIIQGYLLSKPISAEEITTLLLSYNKAQITAVNQ